MKEQSKIPTSKVKRASKLIKTGVKVGGNYIKHYSKKLVNPKLDKEELNKKNAEDIYETLSELKGGALKAAQMLSMDEGILPKAFSDKFSEAQYKAPPLSGPLVVKTFRKYFGKSPSEIYDSFETKASHAASIGQVHKATLNGKTLAIKIQYPGVADSLESDMKLVRPFAARMMGFKDKDLDIYFEEVLTRLLEETDYTLELTRSQELSKACAVIPNVFFANYYPDLSSKRVITMDWLEGVHMDEFLATNPSQDIRNQIGQALWDFYNFQVHRLQTMQADAHPGNFLFTEDGKVGIIDFGCVKVIPRSFYEDYFAMIQPGVLENEEEFTKRCKSLGLFQDDDTPQERAMYTNLMRSALTLLCRPFHADRFDFGDKEYFDEIYEYGERMARDKELRASSTPRGSKDGIYMNRAFFGLFSILHTLNATVDTQNFIYE